jgi:MFS family permease
MNSSIRWRALLPVIGCISAVGLSLGLSIPLVSLTLEYRGTDSSLIGIMAAMPALGILCFSPFVPRLVSHVNARATLFYSIAIGGLSILLLPLLPDYRIWLALRFVMGAADAVLFVVSETWVNQIAEERNRGKLIAIYIAVLSFCFSMGPVLISLTGTGGAFPFLVACAIFFLSAIPLSWARSHMPVIEGNANASVFGFFLIAPTLCSAVLLFAFLDGAVISLLPVFGLRHGYQEAIAAMMTTR